MTTKPPIPPRFDEPAHGSENERTWQQQLLSARSGEMIALNELIETWRTYLLHLVECEMSDDLRQKVGVSDLVQSACLDIHLRFGDFRGSSIEEWRGWLKRMILRDVQDIRRRFLDAQRRDVRREDSFAGSERLAEDVTDPAPLPYVALIAREEMTALQSAMSRLPDDYRQVIRLRNTEGLPFVQVGRQMCRSEEAVRKLWSRAIVRLQQELDCSSG